jgi:3-oxoacid CoA-transferase B subunit
MRAAAAGLGGFFTPTGADSPLSEGKEVRMIGGRLHVFEEPLPGDVALVKGDRADRWGNVTYHSAARNFGPTMAAARGPHRRPGASARRARRPRPGVRGDTGRVRRPRRAGGGAVSQRGLTRDAMARRVAQDLPDGSYVNLGIGLPTLVANHVPEGREIIYHSENGILGMGPAPRPGEEDPELIDAGKALVTLLPGGAYVHHTGLVHDHAWRSPRHLGAGRLPGLRGRRPGQLGHRRGGLPAGRGGAMDLAVGAKRVLVLTTHVTRDGRPKLLEQCSYPLTASGVVDRVYTRPGRAGRHRGRPAGA